MKRNILYKFYIKKYNCLWVLFPPPLLSLMKIILLYQAQVYTKPSWWNF